MKKKICVLLALMLACCLTGCTGGEGQKSELTLDQLAVRMSLKELSAEDAEGYALEVAGMTADNFDEFVSLILKETDKDTDWTLLQKNFAHLGIEMDLPVQVTEEESEFFRLGSFSLKRSDQTQLHLYFHLYSTWFESQGMDADEITLRFDAEKLNYLSAYSSDEIAAVSDDSTAGEVVFRYEDRRATDPAPFDGNDRHGEVLVGIRVEPAADGEAVHSATLKHDGGKETFEITVEDAVNLS